MSKTTIAEVYCTLQIEGTHNWPNCPFDEVDYLRVPHRHMFHIKAHKRVGHHDRATEFVILKHKIQDYFKIYYNEQQHLHIFGAKSCEMIAQELIDAFDLSCCSVDEDGENGSILYVVSNN